MEIKKADFRSDFQSEDEQKIFYLHDLVLDYTSQMNSVENNIYE